MGDKIDNGNNVVDFPTPNPKPTQDFAVPAHAYDYLAKLTGASVDQLKVDVRGGNINPELNASPADAGILVMRLAQAIKDAGIKRLPFLYNDVADGDDPFARLVMYVYAVRVKQDREKETAKLNALAGLKRAASAASTPAPSAA